MRSAVSVAALLPSAACAAARSSPWRSRISGSLWRSRPLHLVDGAMSSTWCPGVPVPQLHRRCAVDSSIGGAKLGWWCVGGRSGVCKGPLPASSSLVAVGVWCCGRKRVLAMFVHRARLRHGVADGSCSLFHLWWCSLVKVWWWFGFLVSGDGGGVVLLLSLASCVCCSSVYGYLYSLYLYSFYV